MQNSCLGCLLKLVIDFSCHLIKQCVVTLRCIRLSLHRLIVKCASALLYSSFTRESLLSHASSNILILFEVTAEEYVCLKRKVALISSIVPFSPTVKQSLYY